MKIVVSIGLAVAALAWGLAQALGRSWLSDDSFISFRYAAHLVEGRGLVYNAGEYVEGYTNLLWTLLNAGAMALGWGPEASSRALGIAFWLALVAVLALRSWRRATTWPPLPLAALLVLLMEDFQTWATGGLETSMFAFLATGSLLLVGPGGSSPRRPLLAGLGLAAAIATRPDGAIFAAVGVAGVWAVNHDLDVRRRLLQTSAAALPIVLVGGTLAMFKLTYYGDLFPTAFYSKSALDPYYAQGWFYVYLFFKKNWYLVLLIALVAIGGARRAPVVLDRSHAVLLVAWTIFVAYVAHSGGDFMFARRILPAMPLLLVVLEDGLAALPDRRFSLAVAALAAVTLWAPLSLYPEPTTRLRGIANEPAYYPPAYMTMRAGQARVAASILEGLPVRAAFEGGMCVFGYYSQLPYLVEMTGLTQYSLAKMPLAARGHIGHEKVADAAWLTDNRIHFIFSQAVPPVRHAEPLPPDQIYFANALRATIWTYDDAIMDRLRGNPRVAFMPIEETLRQARARIAVASYDEAQRIHDALQRFYFRTAGPGSRSLALELRQRVDARRPGYALPSDVR